MRIFSVVVSAIWMGPEEAEEEDTHTLWHSSHQSSPKAIYESIKSRLSGIMNFVSRVLFSEYNVIRSNLIKLTRIKHFRVLIKICAHFPLRVHPKCPNKYRKNVNISTEKRSCLFFVVAFVVAASDKKRKLLKWNWHECFKLMNTICAPEVNKHTHTHTRQRNVKYNIYIFKTKKNVYDSCPACSAKKYVVGDCFSSSSWSLEIVHVAQNWRFHHR